MLLKSKVICIDNFSTGDEKNIDHLLAEPDFKFIRHDIASPIDLEIISELEPFNVKFQGIQEIYYLACPMSPKFFQENIVGNLLANSYGVKNALDLAIKYQAKFMHFSSSVIYGPRVDNNDRLKEDYLGTTDILSPRSSYDEGKRFAETMVINYREVYHLDAKIMRLFRTYGPRMKLNDNQMIPDFINNALDGQDLIIYGDDTFSSSFCYVSDVIDATTKFMDNETLKVVNIGSDTLINVTTLAQTIIDKVAAKSNVIHQPEILFMSQLPVPDISLALNELGWLPVVTLEKGIEKTIYELRSSKGLVRINS